MRKLLADGTDEPHGILTFEIEGMRIAAIDAFINGELVTLFRG
jgi:hypothetical protein